MEGSCPKSRYPVPRRALPVDWIQLSMDFALGLLTSARQSAINRQLTLHVVGVKGASAHSPPALPRSMGSCSGDCLLKAGGDFGWGEVQQWASPSWFFLPVV